MDSFYITLVQTTYGDQASKDKRKECWETDHLTLMGLIRDMWKVWMGAETAYSYRDLHMCVGQYMWHTLQEHRITEELKADSFHKHNKIYPRIINHLFNHREPKVEITSLKGKMKEQWYEVNKPTKDMRLLWSTVGSIKNKVGKSNKGNWIIPHHNPHFHIMGPGNIMKYKQPLIILHPLKRKTIITKMY